MNNSNKQEQAVTSTVYHFRCHLLEQNSFGFRPEWPFEYEPVAQVLGSDLEEAFRLTQGIELSSNDEELVRWFNLAEQHRSTMIGDVIVVDYGQWVETWRCESDRWELLSPSPLG